MSIRFQDHEVKSRLSHKRALKTFLGQKIQAHDPRIHSTDLQYIFCSDPFLLDLNQRFLQHDELTDIISFDLGDQPDKLSAEIYISIDRVKENAQSLGIPYEKELHRVLFHGLLHLLGYKDKSPEDKQRMRKAEDQWLKDYYNTLDHES